MKKNMFYIYFTLTIITLGCIVSCSSSESYSRIEVNLNNNWKTVSSETDSLAFAGFESLNYKDTSWKEVNVPHNWDTYHGYLRKVHGNYHGYAWYRKVFTLDNAQKNKQCFLYFEGVGSYATVWINGKRAGYHAGGRTTFTIDITGFVHFNKPNIIAVRADHPAEIRDLPWVCGGCSTEVGFSEGSQPFGIFRPVRLIITEKVRIEPFGKHIWNDKTVNTSSATLHHTTEVRNYDKKVHTITVRNILKDSEGKTTIAETEQQITLQASESKVLNEQNLNVTNPTLWSPENPYLYHIHTTIEQNGMVLDKLVTKYGIRWVSWPQNNNDSSNQFKINGKPVFLNGVGEYEHMFGNSHAFTEQQIESRISQIKSAGFNAFRDGHQPHNLLYKEHFDKDGMLWWTQLSTHIWFDNPEFRKNFKTLLREWVKERRNSPSNIMWGLQNESTLPEDFAKECVEIIREMDPTTSSQRLVTTCNGGVGTDWNVIQNWSGTYGGNPDNYHNEISEQLLNGEYGAWRSLDLHTEGPFNQNGILSENRMCQLMEKKVRLAESVRDKCCGQFMWIFSSHDNPGRIQSGEALRDIDRIGPVNYKGLLTPWLEPADAYYMYRSNYAPKETEPMVYIVSHTWPNRWNKPGIKDSITIYSNCDEVELFNDIEDLSLGKLKNEGIGIPFIWQKSNIEYNVLYAKGYVNGKTVAEDIVLLHSLPESPNFSMLYKDINKISTPNPDLNYIYRINCGGGNYIDSKNNLWLADQRQTSDSTWGSLSWTDNFENLPDFYGSQRRTFDPIWGTEDWKYIQNFRFGLTELSYNFPIPNGTYQVELYFTEPWYGTGGGMNCKGWRVFDVAINDKVVLDDLDIWSEVGHDKVLKKTITAQVANGQLRIHFPEIKSGQAIISAIAIASKDKKIKTAPKSESVVRNFLVNNDVPSENWSLENWLDIGDKQYSDTNIIYHQIPSNLYASTWIKAPYNINKEDVVSFTLTDDADVFVALHDNTKVLPLWMHGFISTDSYFENNDVKNSIYKVYNRRFKANETVKLGGSGSFSFPFQVFIVPADNLAAPTDQRQAKIYSISDAKINGPATKKTIKGRNFAEITSDGPVVIKWQFYVGIASTYGVHFKFQNNTGGDSYSEMIIETEGGIEMHRETVKMYDKPLKWRTVKTSTGTSINAGTYNVTLKINNAKDLLIQHMEIQ
jgi:hypothetical protein